MLGTTHHPWFISSWGHVRYFSVVSCVHRTSGQGRFRNKGENFHFTFIGTPGSSYFPTSLPSLTAKRLQLSPDVTSSTLSNLPSVLTEMTRHRHHPPPGHQPSGQPSALAS